MQKISVADIFTPQGTLKEISKKPNVDFLMNIFNIPRIYAVSGFGSWNVGQHTVATAFFSLYWSTFNNYPQEKRDRLVTLALVHDVHEAVTGDILPHFKTDEIQNAIVAIQNDILRSFNIVEDEDLRKELKVIDMISFLYEIGQSTPKGIKNPRTELIHTMYARQKRKIFEFVKKNGLQRQNIVQFLKKMNL